MLDAGYVLSLNDAMTGQEKGQWKTVYRYFLRPSVSLRQSEPRRQLFGNVKIELHVLDDRVHHLQCLSTIYSDRSYEAPLPFRELIELLLLQKGN